MKKLLAFLLFAFSLVLSPWLAPALAQPASWNYTAPGNVSTATYPGNVNILGSCTVQGVSCGGGTPSTTVVTTVANIAALQAIGANASATPTVYVTDYGAPGSGGGGLFVWNNTSTAATDLCMTFAATGVSTGRYVRQLGAFSLSLPMCGTIADYSTTKTENHVAIQAAFNAMQTYGLGEVFCPAAPDGIYFNTTITPVAGGTFRGQNNTLNGVLGVGGNSPGSCHLYFQNVAGSGWSFDYQTAVASTCPSTPGLKFLNFTLEQTPASTANGFRINNPSTAGFTDSCSSMTPGQNVVTGNKFVDIVTNSNQRGTTAFQVSQAFDTDFINNYMSFYDTQIQVYGSDNVYIGLNKFNFALVRAVDVQSRGTYGNFDTGQNNTFFSVFTGATDYVRNSARSGSWDHNYIEDDFGGQTTVFNITCALAQTITDNAMEINPTLVSNWLTVSGDCTNLYINNNYNGGSLLPPATFNSGTGSHWYANAVKQVIMGGGNPDGLAGIPFLTRDTQPEAANGAPAVSGSVLSTFDASSNQAIGGDYGTGTGILMGPTGHPGAFVFQPFNAGSGHVTFSFPNPVTGATDLWMLMATQGGTNQQITVTDGVTSATVTLSGGTTPTWYKVLSNSTVTNPSIDTVNNDTTHGQAVYVTRWQEVKH